MNKFLLFTFLIILTLTSYTCAQFPNPKRELRGVWIAALGIDWPSTTGTSAAVIAIQKSELINIMDSHRSYGLNAIFLHMRPICDALYKSSYEPWSHYLTGSQGTPPSDPEYDPLKFSIEEAHNRGMELHAWLNPYRASTPGGSPVSANHVISLHPDWILSCNGSQYRFLNPGLPVVREYVVQIVMDIVGRYDVDGIHFDDYFYPYQEYGTFNDDTAFAQYPNGFTNRTAWRKNNVNLLLKMINDSVKVIKPWVKFGISPSGNPSVNSDIYCDPAAWLAGNYTDTTGTSHTGESYIDYIMPQLYWSRYNNLLPVWTGTSFLNGRHLYVGQAAYRFAQFPPDELTWEITTNRNTPAVRGGVFFSSKSLINNLGYGNDTLEYHYFTHPSIAPKMEWLEGGTGNPNPPANLRFEINSSTGKYELHWDKPISTPNGDTAFAYIIYRFENNPDVEDSTNIFGLTGTTFLSAGDARYSVTRGSNYVVTAINRYSNESGVSNTATLNLPSLIPAEPLLVTPSNGSHDLGMSATLVWSGDSNAERYIVQVAKDSTFNSEIVLWVWEYRNNQITFRNVIPGDIYYWRVKAFGQVGESEFSDIYNFRSGIPLAPVLNYPPHATLNVPLTPDFNWFSSEGATSYRFQLATTVQFSAGSIIFDQTVTDTTFSVTTPLTPNKNYWWRVSAINIYGASFWPTGFGFKTTPVSYVELDGIPKELSLEQNYPNPFNPITEIEFSLANQGFVSLKVYDLLGREIANLVNEVLGNGKYTVIFDASELA
ncbi:MAG: hypothetical protein A2W11_13885, partial [Ignavibacteria bacterium RBG_16_35_7]